MTGVVPRICILVPVYNGEKTIRETIASILAQTFRDFELIVVDNCSTDKTRDVVESIKDPRLSLVRNDRNLGSYGNLNRCIELCRGEFTAIYHADDVYTPQMVEAQVAAFESHPDVGLIFTHATLINERSEPIGSVDMPPALLRKPPVPQNLRSILKLLMKHGNYIITPSAMARTRVYKEVVGTFREDLYDTGADLAAWFEILAKDKALVLPERLMKYRLSTAQHSYQINKLRTTRSDFFKVIDAYCERPQVRALLDDQDFKNYRSLDRTDSVIRSLNYLLKGQSRDALRLAVDTLSREAWVEAIRNRRGLKTFLLGMTLRMGISLHMEPALLGFFRRVRRYR